MSACTVKEKTVKTYTLELTEEEAYMLKNIIGEIHNEEISCDKKYSCFTSELYDTIPIDVGGEPSPFTAEVYLK